jgi:hypothetical protein
MTPRPLLAVALAAAALTGCRFDLRTTPNTTAAPTTTAAPATIPGTPPAPLTRTALDVLRDLPVDDSPRRPDRDKTRPPDQTYNRDRDWQPPPGWGRPDAAGCDTRERILRRDALPGTAAVGPQCRIFGQWSRVYVPDVGGPVTNPSLIEIDHIVALSDAWRSGGWRWFDPSAPDLDRAVARMRAFAQADDVLWAVDGNENGRKNDKGPGDWQPPNTAAGCEYATRYVTIKATWGLTITSRDRDAAGRLLDSCPKDR